jgi:aminopeptidase N
MFNLKGFATLASYFPMETILPDYDIWTQFICERTLDAMELDSLKSTHSVSCTINNPDEIDDMFDSISYHKGACILRMLKNHIGDGVSFFFCFY